MQAKAFSPGNITLFFGIIENKDPLKMGSLGVSLAVDKGVTATVSLSKKTVIFVNGKKSRFPTVAYGLSLLALAPLHVELKTDLPIGHGYGMSGACTLAALYAANTALGLRKSKKELALMAHEAEVVHRTGLGSITAEYLGGVLMRDTPGKVLEAKKMAVTLIPLYHASFGKISTKSVINDENKKIEINAACKRAFGHLSKQKHISLEQLISLGNIFAISTGLLRDRKIKKLISSITLKEGEATMHMLGKSIISTIPFSGSKQISVSSQGARVL